MAVLLEIIMGYRHAFIAAAIPFVVMAADARAQSCISGDPELRAIRPEPYGSASLIFEAEVEPKSRGRTIYGSPEIWFYSRDSYGQVNQVSDSSSFSGRVRADEDHVVLVVKYSGIHGQFLRFEDANFSGVRCY